MRKDIVDGISRASEEQSQGVEQINAAVAQLDKLTQSNAAGAEKSASASEELSAQAETVKATVRELVSLVGGRARVSASMEGGARRVGQHAAREDQAA